MKRPEVLFKIFKTWFKKGNHASVMSEFKCGELHPSWQGGKSFEIYPQKFNVALKERIKKRDNYKCQNCEMTQEEHLIVWGRDIEIHHIDYDKENCKEDNLITLCKQCNMRANYNREYWQLYFEEKILINVG